MPKPRIFFVVVSLFISFVGVNAQFRKPFQCTDLVKNNDPANSAWKLFACLNKKAAPKVKGPTAFWETWPMPDDLYCNEKGTNCDPKNAPRIHRRERSLHLEPVIEQVILAAELSGMQTTQEPFNGGQEVHLNEKVFSYVVANHLWYLQGQQIAFLSPMHIEFPIGAIEVKARWIVIDRNNRDRYFWRLDDRGNYFGLVALNISAKTQPQWFWATFEHVDNPKRCCDTPCTDFPKGVSGEIESPLSPDIIKLLRHGGLNLHDQPWWLNYRLHGTQVGFLDASGKKSTLGNSVLEAPFHQFSSCITCHSRASRNFKGDSLTLNDGNKPGFTGNPDRAWFCDGSGLRTFLSLDYVWSLRQAQPAKNVTPPTFQQAPNCGTFEWLPK